MKDKLLKALEVYLDQCKKRGIEWATHTTITGLKIGAYLPEKFENDKSYAELKAYGIGMNVNGKTEVDYGDDEPFPIDYELWIESVLDVLFKEVPKELKLEDFKLEVPEKIELSRVDYFGEANRVKAKILDDLIKRNVSFNN